MERFRAMHGFPIGSKKLYVAFHQQKDERKKDGRQTDKRKKDERQTDKRKKDEMKNPSAVQQAEAQVMTIFISSSIMRTSSSSILSSILSSSSILS